MSTEDMEKYRILESDKRYRAADRWLDNFSAASWSEVRTFIRSYVPPDKVRELLEMARDAEIARSPPIKVMGLEDRLSEELAWGRALRDNLSIVGSTIPPGDYETQTMPWSYIKEHVFLAPFKGDGGYLTITGKPRKGKTGCGCLYCQMWLAYNPGTEVLTNIPLQDSDKPPVGVRSVSAMSDLLRGIAAALADDRKWLWVLDEAGLVWLRAEAMTIRARGLEKFARIVPKLGGSFIYIEQRIEGVPTVIVDFAESHVFCTSPGYVIVDLPGLNSGLRDVPRPDMMKYRSGETGYFEVDIDMDKLLRALPERGHKTQSERILAFLEADERLKEQPRDGRSGRFGAKPEPQAEAPPIAT